MSAASESPDLLGAALLKVRARAAGLLPAFWGTLVQGAWLGWVQQVDPALAARLHEENQERPFTCSALWLPDRQAQVHLQEAGQRLAVQQGQVCWLRLTMLDGAIFGSFARQALATAEDAAGRAALPPLELNSIPFDLLEMVVDERGRAGAASWSGWTSYARLLEQSQASPARSLARLTLEFDTPTAFGGDISCRPMTRATACAARRIYWRSMPSTRAWARRRRSGWGAPDDGRDRKTVQGCGLGACLYCFEGTTYA